MSYDGLVCIISIVDMTENTPTELASSFRNYSKLHLMYNFSAQKNNSHRTTFYILYACIVVFRTVSSLKAYGEFDCKNHSL